jgi:O-methyltransferase involved in polyketide biosynthesis
MIAKANVTLTPEQETLLIPLYAKAQPENPLFFDLHARDILNQVGYDFARLRVPYKTIVLICQRAKKLDAATRAFLVEQPTGSATSGLWLDSRFGEWITVRSDGTTWTCRR